MRLGPQLPLAGVRLPAWDIGPPYFLRFSAVSGTGPLVVVVVVTLAPVDESLVVTDVEVAAPASATTNLTLTNGPVPDTPENRAKYKPLSRAGNHTAAKGD